MLNANVFGVGMLMLIAFLFSILGKMLPSSQIPLLVMLAVVLGVPILYLVGSALLIWNGRTVIRKEGFLLTHMMGPIVGVIPVIFVGGLIGVLIISALGDVVSASLAQIAWLVLAAAYGYFLWEALCVAGYGALYTKLRKNPDPDAIIIHGAGLANGELTPLLRSRCDTALHVWKNGNKRALLVPSGGQGPDESRPEADAMSAYLLEQGVPERQIVPENKSTTTDENMRFSKLMVDQYLGENASVVFVTSNYHVFRTALIARNVGIDAQGVGSPTARYYLPSAIIRELIAIFVMYKWWHIAVVVTGASFFAILLLAIVS